MCEPEKEYVVIMQALLALSRAGQRDIAIQAKTALDAIKRHKGCRYTILRLQRELEAERETNAQLTELLEPTT